MDLDQAIEYLYERFLEGERINKLILPEFADHLQLEITAAIKQEGLRRRLNQLSGSNENGEIKLWQAYMNEQWESSLVIADEPNLKALEQRLAVLKHFQKMKTKGQQNLFPTDSALPPLNLLLQEKVVPPKAGTDEVNSQLKTQNPKLQLSYAPYQHLQLSNSFSPRPPGLFISKGQPALRDHDSQKGIRQQ